MYIWVMRIPLASSGLRESDIELINQVLRSGNLTMGSEVKKFEKLMCEYLKVKNFIMVNSGSSANLLMFEALLRPTKSKPRLHLGDGILVPAIAWPTTIWPIIQLGLVPIFVDIDPKTGLEVESNKQLVDIRDAIRKKDPSFKTKALGIKFLINAIINYEEAKYNEQVKAEESAFVGTKVARTEASLQSGLVRLKLDLRNIEARILAIETDMTALNAEHDAFLRVIEEDEVKRNNIENESITVNIESSIESNLENVSFISSVESETEIETETVESSLENVSFLSSVVDSETVQEIYEESNVKIFTSIDNQSNKFFLIDTESYISIASNNSMNINNLE
jgi:hypothetical protein